MMKASFRFTIARKLALAFGILMIAVLANSYLTYRTLEQNKDINGQIAKIYAPSVSFLNDLYYAITDSKMLIKNWVFIDKKSDTPDKKRLRRIHTDEYPIIKKSLQPLVLEWEPQKQTAYKKVISSIDELFKNHQDIMEMLNTFDSYANLMVNIECVSKVDENGDVIKLTDTILVQLDSLLRTQEKIVNDSNTKMEYSFDNFQQLIILMAILLFISIMSIGFILTRALVKPLNSIKQTIIQMGEGVLPEEKLDNRTDEIGEMGNALNVLVNGLKKTSEFALEIGESNFMSAFQPLSEEDVLGNSLILMRKNLKKAAQDAEMRKIENNQRSWASQGLAEFGEILRKNNDNLEELSTIVVSKLSRYLGANIGGLFIVNDENKDDVHLELMAFYAYNREKYIKKRIEIGENLVGQCVQEGETMYLTDIPTDYVHITSGLGNDDPKCLLIVPLKMNETAFGVVELASFNDFEPYQIEFVEKIGESIASTISSVKISINTSKLLAESHEKSERLAKQEEEMRKTIEQMLEGQNEMTHKHNDEVEKFEQSKKEQDEQILLLLRKIDDLEEDMFLQKIKLQNTINAVNNSVGTIELTMNMEVNSSNTKYIKMSGVPLVDLIGRNLQEFTIEGRDGSVDFEEMRKTINKGNSYTAIHHYFFDNQERFFLDTFSAVKDTNGNIYKIMVVSHDLTEEKLNEANLKKQMIDLKDEIENLKMN